MDNFPVMMIREDLEDIPQFGLPEGFSFRTYRSGDERHWRDIQSRADKFHEFTQDSFREKFGDNKNFYAPRQLYLISPDGEAVGTATAWGESVFHPERNYGLVHWVAIVPEYQGRGLAKPLMSELLNLFKRNGHSKVILRTSTARIPAICLYRKMGFKPLTRDDNDLKHWRDIAGSIGFSTEQLRREENGEKKV